MVNNGKLTTYISDIALVAATCATVGSISPSAIVSVVAIAASVGIAILDIKYPEFMSKLDKELNDSQGDAAPIADAAPVAEGSEVLSSEVEA